MNKIYPNKISNPGEIVIVVTQILYIRVLLDIESLNVY